MSKLYINGERVFSLNALWIMFALGCLLTFVLIVLWFCNSSSLADKMNECVKELKRTEFCTFIAVPNNPNGMKKDNKMENSSNSTERVDYPTIETRLVPIGDIHENVKYNVTLFGHLEDVTEIKPRLLNGYKFDDGKWYIWGTGLDIPDEIIATHFLQWKTPSGEWTHEFKMGEE